MTSVIIRPQQEIELENRLAVDWTPDMTTDKALSELGLDWNPEVSPVRYGSFFEHQQDVDYIMYRPSDGQYMGYVGRDWYDEGQSFKSHLKRFQAFTEEVGVKIQQIGKLESYSRASETGKTRLNLTFWIKADLNGSSEFAGDTSEFTLAGDDKNRGYLLFTAPYSYGYGHGVKLFVERLVCLNGMTLPVHAGTKIIAHNGEVGEKILNVLQGARTGWQQYQQTAQVLANTPVSQEEALVMLVAKFGDSTKKLEEQPKIVQTVLDMYRNGSFIGSDMLSAYNTAWGLLNCVTEYTNHHTKVKSQDSHLNSLWQGQKAQQNLSFLESISSFAHERAKRTTKLNQQVIQSVSFS